MKRIAAALFMIMGFQTLADADFDGLASGARPLGMGEAFTALADDANAVTYNPAGLALMRQGEFAADYGRPVSGLDDHSAVMQGFAAWVLPLRVRKVLRERAREADKAKTTSENFDPAADSDALMRSLDFHKNAGTLAVSLSNFTLSGAVSENVFAGSFARKLSSEWSGGLSLKGLYQTYTQDLATAQDPVFNQNGKRSILRFSFDAGALWNFYPRIFWGISLVDMNRPNTAVSGTDKEILAPTLRTGFSFRERSFKTALDWTVQDQSPRVHAGAEKWFRGRSFAARAGADLGLKDSHRFSAGFSARWRNVQLDYAFLYPVSAFDDSNGNHKISFIYRFGKTPPEETEPGSLEYHYSQIELESEILKTRLEKSDADRKRLEKAVTEEAMLRIEEKIQTESLDADEKASLSASVKVPEGMKTYVTDRGDTLQSVAAFFYGSANRWPDLYQVNRERIGRAGKIKKGTVLIVPERPDFPPEPAKMFFPEAPPPQEKRPKNPEARKPEPPKLEPAKREAPSGPKIYVVQEEDTLQSIAGKVLGNPRLWKIIYKANADKVERGWVEPGQVLIIP